MIKYVLLKNAARMAQEAAEAAAQAQAQAAHAAAHCWPAGIILMEALRQQNLLQVKKLIKNHCTSFSLGA